MQLKDSVALVTGANRGIGRALVAALLDAGAKRVYATARRVESLDELVDMAPERVVALPLDVTKPEQARAAAEKAKDVTLLINNAGAAAFGDVLGIDIELVRRDLEVNLFGVLNVSRAFAPTLLANQGERAIANVLSVVSFASMRGAAGYCASKAAALSVTQALRADLGQEGVAVHGVFPGPVDTDMARSIEMDKASPEHVAKGILEGLAAGREDIFPDPMAEQVGAGYAVSPKEVEKQFAGM